MLVLVVENLTRNLFLDVVSLEAHNSLKFSPYSTISDEGHHEFMLMRDVAFYFSDSGLMLGGCRYWWRRSFGELFFLKVILR